ncbi:MAG TPA: hypothetical protein VJ746_10195 [Nitrospira sp.]|nr:hypothetical protein [Nitrospira sp.]
MSLRSLPFPLKILATCFLFTVGTGYLFAILYLYIIDLEPHSQPRLGIIQSVIVKYYGKRGGSRLEAVLNGSMGQHVTSVEKQRMIQWLREGAREAEFVDIQPILKQSCTSCHSAQSGLPIAALDSYAEVAQYTAEDSGQSFKNLVRVSHIHLFGMSFIFMLTSSIFALSTLPVILRSTLIAVPFLAIWIDIGSWWFTKYEPMFAYTVIAGGILMGLSLAAQVGVSLYEIWLTKSFLR